MSAETGAKTSQATAEKGVITPERARRRLERLGPTFVKVGQYLALRPDLIGEEYCEEFLKLTDRVPPFPFEDVRRILTEDLGGPPEEFFSWISPRPIAAGSLAQAHSARTRQGDEVAIKVQRPGVREIVERDLKRARLMGRILEMTQATILLSPSEILDEFGRWMREELDFGHELRNLTSLYELSRNDKRSRIPRPYPALSAARVLTAEFLPGVPLTEVLGFIRSNQPGRLDSLRIDPEQVATNLLGAMLNQIFRLEMFHADIHPGNLLVMSGNRIGFVDFGLTDTLDPHFRQGVRRYIAAVGANDIDRMFDGLSEILVSSERSDVNQLRADFQEENRRFQRERRQSSVGRDSPTSRYLVAVLRAARRNRFRVPPAILSLYRSLLTAEVLAAQLGSRASIATVGKPLFRDLGVREVLDAFRPERIQPVVLDGLTLFREGPRHLRRLLSDLVDGRLVLRVRTVDSDEDRQQANARARLISLATVSVALAFLAGATKEYILFGWFHLPWLWWTMLLVVWLRLAVQWRRLQ
jgi:ubiquinone biosynthesis protein